MRTFFAIVFASAAALLAVGCGSSGKQPPTVHPVRGQVVYLDKPAAGVVVYLLPQSGPIEGVPSNPKAITDNDGYFHVTTFTEKDGAPIGSYQIMLRWPYDEKEKAKERRGEGDNDKLLGWYDGINSKVSTYVKAGDNVIPTIRIAKIKGPPEAGSEGVPGRN